MNQSNHLISSPANGNHGIRTGSESHDRDHHMGRHDRDQIGSSDSPQIGFSKPPSSSIMGGLLNDHYLMDQRQNSFRNQQGKKLIFQLPVGSESTGSWTGSRPEVQIHRK